MADLIRVGYDVMETNQLSEDTYMRYFGVCIVKQVDVQINCLSWRVMNNYS